MNQLEIFTFKDLCPVEAVENRVEHDLWVVAVRVELGAQPIRVRDDPCVFAHDWVRRWLQHLLSALGHPRALQEVGVVTEALVMDGRRVEACKKNQP